MKTIVYKGFLEERTHGEADDILFISGEEDPLAEEIESDINLYGRYLTVRYWISSFECAKWEMVEGVVSTLMGVGDADFCHVYSDLTGYLWTDEKIEVGGHDLIQELTSFLGKYCILEIEYSKDKDAKVGHKTADTSFFGYKTHIAMTPERIITAATITTGEKHDGKELQNLVKKSQKNGIEVKAVIGHGAYFERENIEYCESNNIKLASKLSKFIVHGNSKKNNDFEYNKDAGMYVCKAGHMAIKKARKKRCR